MRNSVNVDQTRRHNVDSRAPVVVLTAALLAPFADKWLSTGCTHGGLPLQLRLVKATAIAYRQYQSTRTIAHAQQTAPAQPV